VRKPDAFVASLVADLEARLADLDRERAAIRAALQALRKRTRRETAGLADRLGTALAANPGSRASMLALEMGLPVSRVQEQLKALERAGNVERIGLGWRVS
jgi:hypothetical protein